jgi:hypothetical protein
MGWVLVEGQDADGATLGHKEFTVHQSGGVRAVDHAEQATAAVLRTQAMLEASAQRLHAVGLTWSDDAAADAALVLESLAGAGFDNVVPIRFQRAAEAPTRDIGPAIGSEKTAVCLIEDESVTVVMADGDAGDVQTEVTRTADATDLVRWLPPIFERAGWQPDGLVVAGSGTGTNLVAVARRLKKILGIPVLAQAGAPMTLARGAALASAPSLEPVDSSSVAASDKRAMLRRASRPLTYAGGVVMLVAGVITFVTSISVAVGLRLLPDNGPAEQGSRVAVTQRFADEAAPPPRWPGGREDVVNRPHPAPAEELPQAPPPAEEPVEAPVADEDPSMQPDEVVPEHPGQQDDAVPEEEAPAVSP